MTKELPRSEEVITIRGSLKRQALVALASIGFMVVGVLMMLLPPPAKSVLPWSEAGQAMVGVLAILFGGLGLGVMLLVATRPILLLRPDGLTDCRRRIDVPFSDVLSMSVTGQQPGMAGQWIHLKMVDPQKYAALEKLSKHSGWHQADLTLDLSLAAPSDFQRARQYVEQHVR